VTRLTLVLLVDALRADYPSRMPYLRSLAERSRTGALREDFGFLPRAAYFGGLRTSEHGFTNMYACDPARSPFSAARWLPSSRTGRDVEETFEIRRWIESEARRRVTPFAATYLSSADIPLDLLPNFTLTEDRAPWDARVGYRTIFAEMAERGDTWFACGWPETNMLADRSDRGLVEKALAEIQPPCRFAYLHLQELDGVGHAHGPESAGLDRGLVATDALLSKLIRTLEARFDAVDVVLFGDHGMVSVTGTTDVWAALRDQPIHLGRDVVFFLDSTMARFWFPNPAAKRPVVEALAPLPGRVLDVEDLAALDLAGCDPRNGELYFLAHPGVLILPNFFQRRGEPVRGMHGYHPDCPDNQGFFLFREAGQLTATDLGVVSPRAVHACACRSLGLSDSTLADSSRPAADGLRLTAHGCALTSAVSHQPSAVSPYTRHPDPAAHALVERHMATLVEETRRAIPAATAIALMGSFGRGEGGVIEGEDGRLHPVNDYDVLLIAPVPPEAIAADLQQLGHRLAREFEIDFVHFCHWPAVDPNLPLTLANFDLSAAHRLLWGDPHVLDALPRFAAADMPLFEGVQLLMNRMAGMLTGLRGPFTAPLSLGAGERRYLRNQTMKALMAIGDWHLMRRRAYACSYRTRLERLTWLAPGIDMPADQLEAIQRAYAFKLQPSLTIDDDLLILARDASRWLLDAFTDATSRCAARRFDNPRSAAEQYYALTTGDRARVAADNHWCIDTLARATVEARPEGGASIRQSIYAALPLLLSASHGDESAFAAAIDRLDDCLTEPWPADLTAANWDEARRRTAGAWLTLVH
jgi:hypothetical protein